MKIRAGEANDHRTLVDIWDRAVRATHHFLTEQQITEYYQQVLHHYLPQAELWVAEQDSGQLTGFIGLDGPQVDMLFIDPHHHGQGTGSALLQFAQQRYGRLTVDVNEQNPEALGFYQHVGFVVTGRSPLDSGGKPFPLLHLTLAE